jgi:NAD(P)-dependent dehydrogenase (short-subunit alcohol dehydrogenase family)
LKRTVIITGVGKGFGKELLKYFIQYYYVIGITKSIDDVRYLEAELSCAKDSFKLVASDVTNYDFLKKTLVGLLEDRSKLVYALINNAGVRCRVPFLDISIEEIRKVVEVNLFSAIYLSKILIPYFIANGTGRIINISSLLSKNALPDLSAYTTSKAGLDGFTRSIAAEFAHQNITCNSILPGFCKTSYFDNFKHNKDLFDMTINRTPARRWGTASELIGICELLLGERGGYINGASIPVDGGWTAC